MLLIKYQPNKNSINPKTRFWIKSSIKCQKEPFRTEILRIAVAAAIEMTIHGA